MNAGEKQEALFKLYLIFLRDTNSKTKTCFGEIKTVGLKEDYPKVNLTKEKFDELEYNNDDDKDLKEIIEKYGIKKGGRYDKADIQINGIFYSLKNMSAGRPSIVNHTTRKGFLRIAKQLKIDIKELDKLVFKYWQLREEGKIKEDCGNNNTFSPFKDHKEILRPYIEYFCFRGAGKEDSKCPADYLLKFTKFNKPSTWKIYSKSETVDKIWDGLYFCMRDIAKGSVKDYKNSPDIKILSPWTRYSTKKYRGALSVRYESK